MDIQNDIFTKTDVCCDCLVTKSGEDGGEESAQEPSGRGGGGEG